MADSNTTKKHLANALKELMLETSFHKITISDICNRCNMSRKSFYYHFKDKYDFVNWIFDSEYLSAIPEKFITENDLYNSRWDLIENLCSYFYKNKTFYSKVFRIKGQNCFTDYFRELVEPLLTVRVQTITRDPDLIKFSTAFYSDAFISALERWIVEYSSITPAEFIKLLKTSVDIISTEVPYVKN